MHALSLVCVASLTVHGPPTVERARLTASQTTPATRLRPRSSAEPATESPSFLHTRRSPGEEPAMPLSATLRTIGHALEIKRLMSGIRHFEANDLLHRVGLERQRSTMDIVLPAAGFFVAGAAFGAGLALLLTPATGAQVRAKLAGALTQAKREVVGALASDDPGDGKAPSVGAEHPHNGHRA